MKNIERGSWLLSWFLDGRLSSCPLTRILSRTLSKTAIFVYVKFSVKAILSIIIRGFFWKFWNHNMVLFRYKLGSLQNAKMNLLETCIWYSYNEWSLYEYRHYMILVFVYHTHIPTLIYPHSYTLYEYLVCELVYDPHIMSDHYMSIVIILSLYYSRISVWVPHNYIK